MRIILQSKIHGTSDHTVKILPPINFNCKAIYLTSVSVPHSFYNVRLTNNCVVINGSQYYLTPQNYNANQLAQELTNAINSIIGVNKATVSFNKQKLKYKIATTTPFTINFKTAVNLFGFSEQDYSIVDSIESPFIADINDGIHSIILTANFGSPFSVLLNENFGTQIIARIPITSKPGDIINYFDHNNERPIVKNVRNLQFFEVSILDDNLAPLTLGGIDFQVELFLDLMDEYTDEEFKQMIRRKQ